MSCKTKLTNGNEADRDQGAMRKSRESIRLLPSLAYVAISPGTFLKVSYPNIIDRIFR